MHLTEDKILSPFENLSVFESCFKNNYQGLCYISFKILNDWSVAEDIVQDFFLKCWQNRETIGIKESFSAYAVVSIRNRSLNELSRLNTRKKHETLYSVRDQAENPLQADVQSDYRILNLIKAVNELPEQRRKVFMLIHFEGKKYKVVADEMEISVNTVKTQLRLAFKSLRDALLSILIFIWFF